MCLEYESHFRGQSFYRLKIDELMTKSVSVLMLDVPRKLSATNAFEWALASESVQLYRFV